MFAPFHKHLQNIDNPVVPGLAPVKNEKKQFKNIDKFITYQTIFMRYSY